MIMKHERTGVSRSIRRSRRSILIIILAAFLAASITACRASTGPGGDLGQLLKDKEFSGAILVAKNGQVVFKSALGFADANGEVPLTTRSSFNLASVSKQFTAAAIMILSENGRLQLDDPAAKYLPELAYAPGITIRHLLHHTAGLPDIYDILEKDWDKSKIADNEEVLDIFARRKPQSFFKPGEKMEYSNTGYVMLASVVERVSQLPFDRFLDDQVFIPLEMTDSFVYYRTMEKFPRPVRVYGLKRKNGAFALDDLNYCDGVRGDGNVYSSVEDLFKWDRALYSDRPLKPETIRMMFTPGRLNNGTLTSYGFGFGISDQGRVVSHSGSWVGFRSLMVRYLDREDTMIMLNNVPSPKARGLVDRIKTRFGL